MKRAFFRRFSSRIALVALPVALLFSGCKSTTIESRRTQRAQAYAALSPEQQRFVDTGEIRSGMNEDAVFIAWGPAWEILRGETDGQLLTTWIYRGTWWDEQTYWNYRAVRFADGNLRSIPVLDRASVPRDYVMAEVVFVNGRVKSWRTIPKPYY